MTRMGLALLLLATIAAAPAPTTPVLPVPPIPPVHPPTAQSAPVPDPDARAPQDRSAGGAQVGFTDFRLNRDSQSMGYSPGSQFQTSEDRRTIQTPGLTVRVPLR
jgi:hypothetical protein